MSNRQRNFVKAQLGIILPHHTGRFTVSPLFLHPIYFPHIRLVLLFPSILFHNYLLITSGYDDGKGIRRGKLYSCLSLSLFFFFFFTSRQFRWKLTNFPPAMR